MICCIKPKTWFHNGYKAFRSANLVLVAAWLLRIPLPDEEEGISCTRQNMDAVPCVAAERCIANATTQEAFYNPAHTGLHNPSEKVANAQELGSSYSTDIQTYKQNENLSPWFWCLLTFYSTEDESPLVTGCKTRLFSPWRFLYAWIQQYQFELVWQGSLGAFSLSLEKFLIVIKLVPK